MDAIYAQLLSCACKISIVPVFFSVSENSPLHNIYCRSYKKFTLKLKLICCINQHVSGTAGMITTGIKPQPDRMSMVRTACVVASHMRVHTCISFLDSEGAVLN